MTVLGKQGFGRQERAAAGAAWWRSPGLLLATALLIVLGLVAGESLVALAIVLMEGTVALAVLAAAGLAGGWIVCALGLADEPWSTRLVIGGALGVGLLSLIVLGLGSAGVLTRPVAGGLVSVLAFAGLARLALDCRSRNRAAQAHAAEASGRPRLERFHWLWLAVCPFLVIALLAACLPPGVLWKEEGFGYDVLEYHLAIPKAWFTAGRIAFLPYNVYSNFPLNSEMLSLLMMTLRGDAIEASFMAVMANVGLGGLFVAASWLAGVFFSRRAGVLAGVLAATAPWVAYLAGIAFVEAGMLAIGMAAMAAALRACRADRPARWWWAAGLLAGLACGYKYTAVPLIALPLALFPCFAGVRWVDRIRSAGTLVVAAAITLGPWLIRNAVNTHNPVFPLAYRVFGAKEGTWNGELDQRWRAAHGLATLHRDRETVLNEAARCTIGDFRLGSAGLVLAAVGGWRRRDRWTAALVLMLLIQAVVWATATHVYARFAVVLLLPISLLAARAIEDLRWVRASWLVWGGLLLGAGINLYQLAGLYYDHTRLGPSRQPLNAYGRTDWFIKGQWPTMAHLKTINALGNQANVMMLGDAQSFYVRPRCEYAVVFSSHPLAEAVRQLKGDAPAVLKWLRQHGTTHVFVHWGEIERLRRSYGFYPEIHNELFVRLVHAGLKEIASFAHGEGRPSYGTLYEVPRNE